MITKCLFSSSLIFTLIFLVLLTHVLRTHLFLLGSELHDPIKNKMIVQSNYMCCNYLISVAVWLNFYCVCKLLWFFKTTSFCGAWKYLHLARIYYFAFSVVEIYMLIANYVFLHTLLIRLLWISIMHLLLCLLIASLCNSNCMLKNFDRNITTETLHHHCFYFDLKISLQRVFW